MIATNIKSPLVEYHSEIVLKSTTHIDGLGETSLQARNYRIIEKPLLDFANFAEF